ncbi:MAG: pyridoxal-phosphate dependent enzyme [Marinilabiliaceae bacterium]|jgi:threonine dehydratase|nr:pyridoxal-phosphate dependent enzyme [Marinilabiliaceae bacterium]
MEGLTIPGSNDIIDAYSRIEGSVNRTPVLASTQLNSIFGCDIRFKCENFQKVGAFKFRGATNALAMLSAEELSRGVVTHSSGNHAAALSLAAGNRGSKAYIVMPDNSPAVKKAAVAGYGAEISFCKPTLAAREEAAQRIIDNTGATFIHPYDNFNVICGQGTAALELYEEHKDLDIVLCPVGGGGLLSGTATYIKGVNPSISVFAAEPAGADDAFRSFKSGEFISTHIPNTIADGLLTTLSERTFKIISEKVDDIFTADDATIVECMRLIWERMKIIVEPSSAVTLAVIKLNPGIFRAKKVGVILSGGNVDLGSLPF